MIEYILAFVTGGLLTLGIVYFELNGSPLISRTAALFPIFTWLSYLFIGRLGSDEAVSRHSLFVLLGTIVSWIPYMLIVYLLAPKIGAYKALLLGMITFIACAFMFIKFYKV